MSDAVVCGHAPHRFPIVGHLPALAHDPLGFLSSLPEHGDLVRVRLGTVSAVVVCDAKLFRAVLLDDRTYDKGGPIFDRLREVVGNGLITCPHAEHRRQRRLAQPAFRSGRMPGYTDMMVAQFTTMIGSWDDGQVIDASEELMRMTTRVAVATLFSERVTPSMLDEMSHDVTTLITSVFPRMLTPPGWEWLLPGNRRFLRARARLRGSLGDLISAYRAEVGDRGDLMSMLLPEDAGDGFSDIELTDQATSFFGAGAETTANVLASALHVLAHQPKIQDRVSEEARRVLSAGPLSYQRLVELRYANDVLTETLRLYPPGWLLTRRVTVETELGGHPMPAGTVVVISPYLLHRRADLFEDPETFRPEREISALGTPTGGFVPFGAGTRKCIGESFARVEAVVLLAILVDRWRILPVTGARYRATRGGTLAPRGLRVRLAARPTTG